jgi:hypothetical protein
MNLTRDERRRIYQADYTALKRPEKPDVEPGDTIVLSWTRGVKQVVDRDTGATIEVPRIPTFWIEVTEIIRHTDEWVVRFKVEDRREPNRVLMAGTPGVKRQAGLKTRWRKPKDVPPKGTQTESWTAESERGYGSGGKATLDDVTAVSDGWLERDRLEREVDVANAAKRQQHRAKVEKLRLEGELNAARRRGSRKIVSDISDRISRLDRRLDDAA